MKHYVTMTFPSGRVVRYSHVRGPWPSYPYSYDYRREP